MFKFWGGVNFGSEPYLIELRNNCKISGKVTFITHDGGTHAFRYMCEHNKDIVKFGTIIVDEWAFVGNGSTIMPNVKIGKHSVIGAGSVVTNDVPDYTVWAGVPARQICTLDEYQEKCKSLLENNFDINQYKKNKKEYLIRYFWERET